MNGGTRRISIASAGLLLAMAGGVAAASPDTPAPVPASTPLIRVQGDVISQGSINSKMVNSDGDTVEVTIHGVDAEVIVNGASAGTFRVDGDWTERTFGEGDSAVRIIRKPGGLLKLEQKGATMTMQTAGPGMKPVDLARLFAQDGVMNSEEAVRAFGDGVNIVSRLALAGEPPKVMLGVTMARPVAEQVEAFGYEPAKATVLGTVIDGLPAANAGLVAGDIIVGIGDSDDGGEKAIRERLSALDPGDVLTFKVLRDGKLTIAGVKLEPYDQERLGAPAVMSYEIEIGDEDPELQALRDEQKSVKQRYLEAMQQALNADGQRARDRANAEAEKLNAELQGLTTRIAKKVAERGVRRFLGNNASGSQVIGDREGQLFVFPQSQGLWTQSDSDTGPVLERLLQSEALLKQREARIAELETRLDDMTRKLDRLEAILLELKDQKRN